MKLNERICKARKEKGFTQEELADLAKVTVRTIQRIESGENVPRSYTLKAIAKALDLSYETLTIEDVSHNPASIKQQSDKAAHFLKVFNLSCFSYILVPWVHFLVPTLLLNKQKNINENAAAFGRRIIRQTG